MSDIELRNLTKRFSASTVVGRANAFIHDGEFFILVGPSGCGKSTLLHMIVGLEEITEGEILLDGERVNDLDPKERNMAMVFQSYAIYPHMTVGGNMAFPLKLARLDRTEIGRRVAETARMLGLEDVLDRRPGTLSGGQRQRVAMGRALVRRPKVFLLDEPLSNLDAKLRVEMRTEIARLQRRLGTTTVYVTHDQTEAMTLGDRIAVMRKGGILQIGTPRELYERPNCLFVAGFIGSPAMNFLPARWLDGRLELPVGKLELSGVRGERAGAARGGLVAGFRPEHLEVVTGELGGGTSFEARAEVVEWLGADMLVYFDFPFDGYAELSLPEDLEIANRTRRSLVARVDPATGVREGEMVRLRLDPSRVEVFDADGGENLAHGEDRAPGGPAVSSGRRSS